MFENYFNNSRVHPAPLAVFRISFGILMWIALIRFWLNGWIESLYLAPKFHFKYYGFEWVDHFGPYTYVLYIICLLSTLGITFGYRYRLSIITFFLVFTSTSEPDLLNFAQIYDWKLYFLSSPPQLSQNCQILQLQTFFLSSRPQASQNCQITHRSFFYLHCTSKLRLPNFTQIFD